MTHYHAGALRPQSEFDTGRPLSGLALENGAGGYQKREFWKQPFVRDGRAVTGEDAVALFHDATGRPGPATWEVGGYPKGHEKSPVAGVSWYEAMAYAEFAGKSLPTAYHWT